MALAARGDRDRRSGPECRHLVHRHHQQPAGHPGGVARTGRVVRRLNGPDVFHHGKLSPGIPRYAGLQPLLEGGRNPDAAPDGKGIAHLDLGATAVHGRAVAGLPAGGLSQPGSWHQCNPPRVVHSTGPEASCFTDRLRRELCPTTCMLL